ncbi:MAG: peptidoglycan D,D-transpeptidase FtsI family protein [Microgenomates group bacterium]
MFRLKILAIIFFAVYVLIISRLFIIQIKNQKTEKENYLQINKIQPERGKIYDQNKKPLVLNQNSYFLYLEKPKIENKDQLVLKLSQILNVDPSSIEAKIEKGKYWIPMTLVDEIKKNQIVENKLKGVGFEYRLKRYYPEASLSAHILGFLGKNEKGEDVGYFGLEGYYNKELAGLPGFLKSEKDLLGRPIMIGLQEKIESESGSSLILNIDKSVQEIAKKRLLLGVERYQAKGGCVIIAKPQTMAILALVCLPDFDPERYYFFNEEFFKNPAISNLFEPGSIFKPLIMAAAIEEKKISPDDFYNETGPITIGNYQIRTWNNKYEGKITMTRILEKSSNVGMVYVGEKLGKKNLLKYLKKFGFGQLTGIDLQGEVAGVIKSEKELYPIDYATITFGQGIAVTSIQMINAFNTLINDGNLMRPFVVRKIVSDKEEKIIEPTKVRQVISQKTSLIMKKMLQSSIENAEVKWAKPKGYSFGGKTGTAQIPIQGRYDPSKTNASFIGFFPVEKPQFIVLVTLKEPTTSFWGSETAGPIFFEVAKDLIVYYGITPD